MRARSGASSSRALELVEPSDETGIDDVDLGGGLGTLCRLCGLCGVRCLGGLGCIGLGGGDFGGERLDARQQLRVGAGGGEGTGGRGGIAGDRGCCSRLCGGGLGVGGRGGGGLGDRRELALQLGETRLHVVAAECRTLGGDGGGGGIERGETGLDDGT